MPAMPRFARLTEAPDWVRNYYRLRLDIEFRSVRGEAFQRLFDKVMRSIHGKDYQATAALGSRGDFGCDGFLNARNISFACYGPDPYFKIDKAVAKLRDDFQTAVTHWEIPGQMQEWVFVINYPGTHPVLLREAERLASNHPGLTARIWTRQDIMEQFLLWARRSTLIDQFGAISSQARSTGRAFVVPEGTALPRKQAALAAQKVRARLSCDRHALDGHRNAWFDAVAADPFACLIVQVQFLIGAIAAPTMAGLLDPERVKLSRLLRESEMSSRVWKEHGKRAWDVAMGIINSAETGHGPRPVENSIGDDFNKLVETIAAADMLVLGLIRMYSRDSGDLETECLDDVWHYVSTIPIREDDGHQRS